MVPLTAARNNGRDLVSLNRRVESGNVLVHIAHDFPVDDPLLADGQHFVLDFRMPDGAGVPYAVRDPRLTYRTVYRCDEDSRCTMAGGSCITQTSADQACEFSENAASPSIRLTIDAQDPSHVVGSGHLPITGAGYCCFYDCFTCSGRNGPGPFTLYEEWVDVTFDLLF